MTPTRSPWGLNFLAHNVLLLILSRPRTMVTWRGALLQMRKALPCARGHDPLERSGRGRQTPRPHTAFQGPSDGCSPRWPWRSCKSFKSGSLARLGAVHQNRGGRRHDPCRESGRRTICTLRGSDAEHDFKYALRFHVFSSSSLTVRGLVARVAAIGAGGGELAELVTDHILGDIDGDMLSVRHERQWCGRRTRGRW